MRTFMLLIISYLDTFGLSVLLMCNRFQKSVLKTTKTCRLITGKENGNPVKLLLKEAKLLDIFDVVEG